MAYGLKACSCHPLTCVFIHIIPIVRKYIFTIKSKDFVDYYTVPSPAPCKTLFILYYYYDLVQLIVVIKVSVIFYELISLFNNLCVFIMFWNSCFQTVLKLWKYLKTCPLLLICFHVLCHGHQLYPFTLVIRYWKLLKHWAENSTLWWCDMM